MIDHCVKKVFDVYWKLTRSHLRLLHVWLICCVFVMFVSSYKLYGYGSWWWWWWWWWWCWYWHHDEWLAGNGSNEERTRPWRVAAHLQVAACSDLSYVYPALYVNFCVWESVNCRQLGVIFSALCLTEAYDNVRYLFWQFRNWYF